MVYITVKQSPRFHQITLEELLFGGDDVQSTPLSFNSTNTRTYECQELSDKIRKETNVADYIQILRTFNEQTKELHDVDRHELYHSFVIPKKSGGLRHINAPEPPLMNALRMLKTIFEEQFHALYHTSAFAYVKKRSIVDCLKRHQKNESKWYSKFDMHDFFGSTTKEFVTKMFSMIYPFSEVLITSDGRKEFDKAIDLAFLDGGLPQGTPISPTITNIMMIPIDFELSRSFREFNHQRMVYTRYADDMQISCKYTFKFKDVEKEICRVLEKFEAPFHLNNKKTRYGSSAGSNWNLGIMINKDNEMTVGHKNKKRFQAMLSSYIMDRKNGKQWSKHDMMEIEGLRNYYTMVEGDTINRIIDHINKKFGVNVVQMLKEDIRNG